MQMLGRLQRLVSEHLRNCGHSRLLEGAHSDRRPQRRMEPDGLPATAVYVCFDASERESGDVNFWRITTKPQEQKNYAHEDTPAPWRFYSDGDHCPCGPSVTDAAKALRISRAALSSLLNSKAALPAIWRSALKRHRRKLDTLMRMQSSYDIAQTRKRERDIRVRRIRQPAEIHQ